MNARDFLSGLFETGRNGGVTDDTGIITHDVTQANPPEATITAADLPEYWREFYEERAAIREYDGRQAREHAEAEALRETIEAMQAAGIRL